MDNQFHVYACVRSSDSEVLRTNLMLSPEIANGKVGLTALWDQRSAADAYARAMGTAAAQVVVFAHSDVYFADGWFERLKWEVDRLNRIDGEWAVASVCGMTASGEMVGQMWDCSLVPILSGTSGIFGKELETPVPIVSLDESAFVVRRDAGINFDPLIPEFHLYGNDLVLEAERQGKLSYGLDLPILHNAKPQLKIAADFVRSYKYMVRKWSDRLPVITPYCTLTSSPFWLPLRRMRIRYKAICRPSTYSTQRITDPHAKAIELGLTHMLLARTADAGGSNRSTPSRA
jgi:hypothetical protein